MRKIIEASLVLSFAILLTVVIMAMIIPKHARGGNQPAPESASIWPAVFVSGTHQRPGSAGCPADPKSADTSATAVCPYLAALAAPSKCPAAPERNSGLTCPYLQELQPRFHEAKTKSTAVSGQHI
jgi:hypothetical protein